MSTDINETLGVSPQAGQPGYPAPQGKHSSLKKVAGIMTVLAWIAGGIIFIMSLIIINNTGRRNSYYGDNRGLTGQSILIFIAYLYLAVLVVVSLLAQAGIAKVLVDIEENTRKKN